MFHSGSYNFNRIPFGLKNSPLTFHRTFDLSRSYLKWKNLLVYLDDIIVVSKYFDSHLRHGDNILSEIDQANVTIELKSVNFSLKKSHTKVTSMNQVGFQFTKYSLRYLKSLNRNENIRNWVPF